MSFKETYETAEALSHGCMALNLVPEVEGEEVGKKWRFMGIQSKNRAEWSLLNISGMFQGVTSVAFFDTLGEEAIRFIIKQTMLSTMGVSKEMIPKICAIKSSDSTNQMETLVNLICFDDDVSQESK